MSLGGSEQLTRKDVKRLEEEMEHRKTVLRPELLKALKAARAQGDLSENYEYTIAKRENNQNNSRIRYIEKMLRNVTVVEEEDDAGKVGINNTVTVYFEDDDIEEDYRIVTPIRCNSLKRLISNESPLGKALLGHKKDDRVEVDPGTGDVFYVVIKDIIKTGESDEDRIHQF